MIKGLRDFLNWLEIKNCLIRKKWNNFLDNKKVKIHYCKNCLCEK